MRAAMKENGDDAKRVTTMMTMPMIRLARQQNPALLF
jgi:hypothetical protein